MCIRDRLIHSRNDQAVPPANMPYIYERIASPDKAMCWIENSGHVLTVDYQKETVFEKVYQFITKTCQVSKT